MLRVSSPAAAQRGVVLRDPGPGPVGSSLSVAIENPHTLVGPGDAPALLARDTVYRNPVIVLGRNAIIEGRVHGDVIVVGGDAFVHPGANVDGRVVAIGGGAYGSRLAVVREGLESHRDFTFDVTQTATEYVLDYRALRGRPTPVVTLPGLYGVRLPNYARSDGLSLPFAPLIALDAGTYEIEPTITYRSHIGEFDPSVLGRLALSRSLHALLYAGRGTFTNERWIWSDLVNSASVIGLGNDTRNYYRADRAEAVVHRLWEARSVELEPFVGVRVERDREIGPDSVATGGPWSFFGRTSREEMLRPNPPATRGSIRSAIGGARLGWAAQGLRVMANVANEVGRFSTDDRQFVQSVLDAEVRFPTYADQMFWMAAHVVYTFGDSAPPQRWSYLGGSGTLPTLDLLSMGGDRLLFVESNYYIPIRRFDFPFVGSPSITLRHAIGAAGVARLPSLEQNISLRLAVSFARVELDVDPARRDAKVTAGLSFTR
jgi:hypothetical protein